MNEDAAKNQVDKATRALIDALTFIEQHSAENFYHLKQELRCGDLYVIRRCQVMGPQYHMRSALDGPGLRERTDAFIEAMNHLGDAGESMQQSEFSEAIKSATKAVDLLAGLGMAAVKGKVTAASAIRRWATGMLFSDNDESLTRRRASLPVQYLVSVYDLNDYEAAAAECSREFLALVRRFIAESVKNVEEEEFIFSGQTPEEASYFSGYLVGFADLSAQRRGGKSGEGLSQHIAQVLIKMADEEFELELSFEQAKMFLAGEHRRLKLQVQHCHQGVLLCRGATVI